MQVRIVDDDRQQTLATVDTLARDADGPVVKPGRSERIVLHDPVSGQDREYYVDNVTHHWGVVAGRLDITGMDVHVRLLRPSSRTPNPLTGM